MSSKTSPPVLLCFCGPNGAGKSTLAREHPSINNGLTHIDADKIQKEQGVSPMRAGKEVSRMVRSFLAAQTSFTKESTLTSQYDFLTVKRAHESGFRTKLVYIGLQSPQLAITRVRTRVLLGGHFIPTEAILRRYKRGLDNLLASIGIFDRVAIYDNSETYTPVAYFEQHKLMAYYACPQWFADIHKKLDLPAPPYFAD